MTRRVPTSRNIPDGRLCEGGTVLIVVMWIALGLVSIALYFGHSMVFECRGSDNSAAGLKATQAIEGARRYVSFVLANLEEPNTMPDIESYSAEQAAIEDAAFWLIGRRNEDEPDNVPVFGLVDEASKLNLNTATRDMLEQLPGMPPELAAAIIDWRDTDNELSPDGAESETYLSGDPEYYCKDSNFETIEELRMVIGAEWDILYGEDTNRNGVRDPNEDDGDEMWPPDDLDGTLDPGVLEYLTVYSREPNAGEEGAARINITSGSGQELGQLLQETFGQERGLQIQQAVGRQAPSMRSLLEFYTVSGMTPDEFSQVDDALTVSDDDFVEGLVNVNTASAAVLACLPGIGEDYAGRLVAYRQGKSSEDLASVAWVTEVLDDTSAIEAGPYLTTGTYQFAADVAAVGHLGRGFRRTLYIFDISGGAPTVVYSRDMTRLGWPLGGEIREQYISMAEQRK